jgi:hypothetical protein
MVNSKLRRHKVMEKAIKKLMAANLPPRFKFEDTYNSIVVPVEYQQHLPTQSQLEAEFDALIIEEDAMPTTTTDIENLDIISANVYSNTATGRVGIGTASPAGTLHVHSTDSIVLPGGTTAQRNSTPVNGMLRYNTETEYMEVYTDGGWGSLASPPTITSFSPSVVSPAASNGTVLTINGSLFDQNASVELRNESGDLYSTSNPAFTNSGLITATLGSLAAGTYTVIVTNGSGLSVDSTSTFSVNNPPVWNSPADGATLTFLTNSSTTTTLSATDPDGSAVTYSLVSGTLPSGLTLSGNTISGTSGAASGTSTPVTIRASDGTVFTDRSFTIATVAPLYPFTSHTFTNASATGRYGPTLTQMRTAYSSASWSADTNYFNQAGNQGYQLWTVPLDGTYRIAAIGASGGLMSGSGSTNSPGKGAYIIADFYFVKSTKIVIIVGQRGEDTVVDGGQSSGGGGATWVLKENFSMSSSDVYMIAGGGGGSPSTHMSNTEGGYANGSSQGTLGGGGGSGAYTSGGGAGWTSSGASTTTSGGRNPYSGAIGGSNGYNSAPYITVGGFGGGGGPGAHAGGGGGGASGGNAANPYNSAPYGGTSYIMPNNTGGITVTNRTFMGNAPTKDHGSVTITLL